MWGVLDVLGSGRQLRLRVRAGSLKQTRRVGFAGPILPSILLVHTILRSSCGYRMFVSRLIADNNQIITASPSSQERLFRSVEHRCTISTQSKAPRVLL